MFVCVVWISQPSSRDLLYVKCLCLLSGYHSPVVEIYVKCFCVLFGYHSPVVEICYMLNVLCVCVGWLSQPSGRDLLYVKCLCVLSVNCVLCVISFSQPSSRELLYVKCLCVLSRYPIPVVEICYMLNVCVCCLVFTAQ